jgi:hypothetical protein
MDEDKTIIQPQSSEPAKTSKWVKAAIWCVVFGYLAPISWIILISILPDCFIRVFEFTFVFNILNTIIILGAIVSIIAGLICGIIAIIRIAISRGRLKGIGRAITAVTLSSACILLATILIITLGTHRREITLRKACSTHLSELGKAMKIYADEHGAYPAANQWCDILVKNNYTTKAKLEWPRNQKAKCSYAINPNCEPNSTGDVVLLFETKGGWNIFGGAELLTIDSHQKGEGAFILYNGGYVRFNIADPNGKIIDELNWGEKDKGRGLK